MFNGSMFIKSPVYLGITIALFGSVNALATDSSGPEVIRSISLVKQPIVQPQKQLFSEFSDKAGLESSLFHNEISRELNKYPGIFATHTIINGQTLNVSHNSAPAQMGATVLRNQHSLRPLPYLDRSLMSFSAINRRSLYLVEAPDLAALPSGLVGGIAADSAAIGRKKQLDVAMGSDNQADLNIDYGQTKGKWGHLFHFSHQQADSYRETRSVSDSGMKANDISLKISEQGALGTTNQQITQFSLHYREYENDESRFGVMGQDVDEQPPLRYSATALDNERTEQLSFALNHDVVLASGEVINTLAYYDDGEAGFYQTANVNGLTGANAATYLSEFENAPLTSASVSKTSLNRDYASGGIKITINQSLGAHDAALGVNYHSESVRDMLFSDIYRLDSDLSLSLTQANVDDRQSKTTLNAKSVFVTDHWRNGALSIEAGLKHERIERQYTQGGGQGTVSESSHTFGNATLTYQLSESLALFISGQEGLLASTNWSSSALAQTSQNVRGGIKYRGKVASLLLVGFNNDFYNVFSRCYTIAQCSTLSDERNDINIRGVEVSGKYVIELANANIPLSFSYTHREHEYSSELDVQNINNDVAVGDELAFLPKNQAFAQLGFHRGRWDLALRASYRGPQRRVAGIEDINSSDIIEEVTLLDLSASYKIDNSQQLFATLNNATDQRYVESAFNNTNVVGRGRSVLIGYRVNF